MVFQIARRVWAALDRGGGDVVIEVIVVLL
jgi:hypothetical protein